MKLSIIVPAYNEELTIVEVLHEVNGQQIDGVNFEVIVIDDGSTDATLALLEENSGLYSKLIKMEKNGKIIINL